MLKTWGACWIKMCLKLEKCWICWICWMFSGELEERGGLAKFSPKHSTYSTFPLKEAHFDSTCPREFNIFNISPERSTFFQQGLWDKCLWGGGRGGWGRGGGECEEHAIPIHHPPPETEQLIFKTKVTFPQPEAHNPPKKGSWGNVKSCFFYVLIFPQPEAHFQKSFEHFPSQKHTAPPKNAPTGEMLKVGFSLFHISPARSTFSKKLTFPQPEAHNPPPQNKFPPGKF